MTSALVQRDREGLLRVLERVDVEGWNGPVARELLAEVRRIVVVPLVVQVGLRGVAAEQASSTGWAVEWEVLRAPSTRATTSPWLYALHVRSSLARGRRWQAIHMINGMRERVLELTCARHGLPTHHGRGVDDLPDAEAYLLSGTFVTSADDELLHQALRTSPMLCWLRHTMPIFDWRSG